MRKEPDIKNGARSKEELDSARELAFPSDIIKLNDSFTHTRKKKKKDTKEILDFLILCDSIQKFFQETGGGAINHHLGSFHPNEF